MVNGNCLTGAKRKEFRELTIKPKARPSKSEGLGEFFGRSRGGISPSWVWAKPKVLA